MKRYLIILILNLSAIKLFAQPPIITALVPANNATNVMVNSLQLTISFDKNAIPVGGRAIRIFDLTNPSTPVEEISITAGAPDRTFTYSLRSALSFTKTYFVNIDDGAFQDNLGSNHPGILDNSTWRFTTGTPPTITTFDPANNATNVLTNTQLTITFDKSVAPVAAAALRIFDLANPNTPVEEIQATSGVQMGRSFAFAIKTNLNYLKTYFVNIDYGAFQDSFGFPDVGILDNSTWRFTVQDNPDPQAPTIVYTPTNFTKGLSNVLAITVTDNVGGSGVNPSTVKLYYRGIVSSAAATEVTIPNTTGNTYQISIPDGWMDELGLEFYFLAADIAGNIVRSPAGTALNTARIMYPETNQPTIPSSFIGVGGKAADYKLFSIPLDLQNGTVGSIFNELGAVDNTHWRIVQYVNSSESYSDATTISRGTGYWINTKTAPPTIFIEGAATPNNTKTSEFQMELKTGWNLIGNPYPFIINWEIVKGANANIGDVKTYNGGFITDNTLSPFEAGFVWLNGSNVSVTIPFSAKTNGRMHDSHSFKDGWLLPLTLEVGEQKNDLGGVGMREEADRSFDQFDDVSLPRLFDIPEIHFSHPEHFTKKFTRDVVPVLDEFAWRFIADVQEGTEAVLSWNYDQLDKFDKELFLLDESCQMLINMLEQNRYSFLATKSPTFKVYYGADLKSKIKPTSTMLGKPYPNPTQSNSGISFTLPENATGKYNVVLDVYDLLGNKITTLTNDQLGPGFYTTSWSPEQSVSPGLYIYRLMVDDHSNKKILTEKLIILK